MAKHIHCWLLIALFGFLPGCKQSSSSAPSTIDRERSFNSGWLFAKNTGGTATDAYPGAEAVAYDDSAWRSVDVPHDWSVEDLSATDTDTQVGPFSATGSSTTGYLLGGVGWYRKHFKVDAADAKRVFTVLFDGVAVESDVYINGTHLGFHPYPYTGFAYDLTPYLNTAGEDNVLAVRAVNVAPNSRWYVGSGVYRDVKLLVTNPIHVDVWGVQVTTPVVSAEAATVALSTTVRNDSTADASVTLRTRLLAADGTVAGTTRTTQQVSAGASGIVAQELAVTHPALWSPDSPSLYTAEVSLYTGDTLKDVYTLPVGIRSIGWDAVNGLTINGQSTKLYGGCVHHSSGLLGAAAFDRSEERKIEILKANGYNAVRTAHNPPSAAFLDAADRLGVLVLDEFVDMWEQSKNSNDYTQYFDAYWEQDLSSMLLRDRNHPSVFAWSVGNEIGEGMKAAGWAIYKQLTSKIHDFDLTRPVTEAINPLFAAWSGGNPDASFLLMDVAGYNYAYYNWGTAHASYPDRVMMLTESWPLYRYEDWQLINANPWGVGEFVWSGVDYLGEAGVGWAVTTDGTAAVPSFGQSWPWFINNQGDIDIIGNKKPQAYYRDVLWNHSDLEVLVHRYVPTGSWEVVSLWGWPDERPMWTWPGSEGRNLQVTAYTQYPTVQLYLDDQLIGTASVSYTTKANPPGGVQLTGDAAQISGDAARFTVPYAPGTLKAVALDASGNQVATRVLSTVGADSALALTPDRAAIRADRSDLAFLTVDVMDADGATEPNAAVTVTVAVDGPGELIAAGNAAPNVPASFQRPTFRTWHGKALVVVRPTGEPGTITVTATSAGLQAATATITAQ
jgi:beta-galactosidase